MAKEYFSAYHSYLQTMEPLNDAERGRLFTACLQYSMTGEVPELRGNERFVFPGIRSQIDRDTGKYNDYAKKQSENGKKGGRPRKANESQKTQAFSGEAKKAKEKEKEKEMEKKKEIEKEKNKEKTPLEAAFSDFSEMRQKIRAPLTERAKQLILSDLEKLAPENEALQIRILEQSTQRGWRGVFPLRDASAHEKQTGYDDSYEEGTSF